MSDAKARLIGNIGKMEPQYTPQGTYLVKGTVAITTGKGDKKSTDWYEFIVWGNYGELFNKFCKVGTHVLLEGDLRIHKWQTEKSSGTKVELTVSEFKALRNTKSQEDESSTPYDEEAAAVDEMYA